MQILRGVLPLVLLPLVCYAQQCIRRYTSNGADCRTLGLGECSQEGTGFGFGVFSGFGGIGINNPRFLPGDKLVFDLLIN